MEEVTDILGKALSNATADLSVLRWMRREQINVTITDGVPRSPKQTTFEGVSCRSLINGSWGFASTTIVTDAPEMVQTSERLACISSRNEFIDIADTEPVSGEWKPVIEKPVSDIEVLYEVIKEVSEAVESVPHITSTSSSILVVTDEKVLMTSEGTHVYQVEPRIMGALTAVAKESGKISQGRQVVGGEIGLEFFEKGFAEVFTALCEKVSRRVHAPLPPAGKTPVVLSGEVVGLLVHEALGHAAEADVAQCESFLSGKIGERVASPLLSVADDGTLPGGFGSYGFDDEGVPAQDTVIVADGVLQNYLHSRETAFCSHTHSTGNGRAWLFSREPQVRMTNTYVHPDDMSFEELCEEVKNGLYISGDKGGSADRNGQFVFITSDAQKIEKGELTEEYFLGPVISGHAQEAFTACTGAGNRETFVVIPAVCKKGESAFVGSGGPAVATEVVVGGI